MKLNFIKAALCSFPLLLATHAAGAVITWDAAPSTVNISDPLQVSTVGTLFLAAAGWSTGATVNTVTFQHFGVNPDFTLGPTDYGIGGTVTNEYSKLIADGYFLQADEAPTKPSVFSNLIDGHQYQLQIWVPVWNGDWPVQFGPTSNGTRTGNTGTSPTLHDSTNPDTATQYIFGTFAAVGTTQDLYQFAQAPGSFSWGGISAVQLRDVTGVPEPTTVALFSCGALALFVRSRIRQRKLTTERFRA